MGAGSPGQFLIDLLYPRRCPLCHEAAPYGEKICPDCRRKLPVIRTRRCALCSKPVEGMALGIDDNANLIVRLDSGEEVHLSSGEANRCRGK